MKQSPFKFQGNNSKEAKNRKSNATAEHEDPHGKQALSPKDVNKVQPRAKSHTMVRTGRPVNTQRPKAK